MKAYGGFGGEASSVGAWTAERSSTWLCLMTIARLCNYTYRFKFSEDWQRADIEIRENLCCVTGAPCCCKPWFFIPDSWVKFETVQAEDSSGGSHWIRNSSHGAGGPMKKSYDTAKRVNPIMSFYKLMRLFAVLVPRCKALLFFQSTRPRHGAE